MPLRTRTIGVSRREYVYTRYRRDSYTSPDQFRTVWAIDRADHHWPAWRGPLCVTKAAALQPGGPTALDPHYGMFYFETDAPTWEQSRDAAVAAVQILHHRYGVPMEAMRFFYSGNRSTWVRVDARVFGVVPSAQLGAAYQSMVTDLARQIGPRHCWPDRLDIPKTHRGKTFLDDGIYNWNRIVRCVNSRHDKSGRYAIPLTWDELRSWSSAQLHLAAMTPREMLWTFAGLARAPYAESPAANDWYHSHVRRVYQERRKTAIAAAKQAQRAPRYKGLRACVQALLNIQTTVPHTSRNKALYSIGLGFRDAGRTEQEALGVAMTFYAQRCDHVPGEDDTAKEITATIRSAYKNGRRFSQKEFNKAFGDLLASSSIPDTVQIPRAEMARLFAAGATAGEWIAFFRDWARRPSPEGCRSYVRLERGFVDVALPLLVDGSIKTFAALLYASSLVQREEGGAWAYLIHARVTKATITKKLGLAEGTVGRHLALLRRLRFVVGQTLNPVPIPIATISVGPRATTAPVQADSCPESEEVKAAPALQIQGSPASVNSLVFLNPVSRFPLSNLETKRRVPIPLRVHSKPLGTSRKKVNITYPRATPAADRGSLGLAVAGEPDWPFY